MKQTQLVAPEPPPLRLADLPPRYISIDPGSVHCGVAYWEVDRLPGVPVTVRLVEVYERTPDGLYVELREMKRDGIGVVLCEDFLLQKGRNQAGSRLETVKTIGVIEYIARMTGLLTRLQSSGIKSYVDAWLRAKCDIEIDGTGTQPPLASNSHKRDAIRHGLYPALRNKTDRRDVRLVLDEHRRGRG